MNNEKPDREGTDTADTADTATAETLEARYYELMLGALNSVYSDCDFGTRINAMLGMIGEFINVSRVYIFEDDFENKFSKNTYEWCAEGVIPQIDDLQYVPHELMGTWHDMLREHGMIVADDLKTLPEGIFDQLSTQGILSIVVLPLYIDNVMFGYIGFDECLDYRHWTDKEIAVLRALSTLVETLIARYNAENKLQISHKMFRTVFDNIEAPIYVSDLDTNRILFANKRILEELNRADIEGEICWQVLKAKNMGVCENCPVTALVGMEDGAVLHWEVYNDLIGKWYYCTDSLVEWVDGRKAHLQTALDITSRKNYEEKLKVSASYDAMTGIYNRESGISYLRGIIEAGEREGFTLTFCYFDIDELKHVNDTYGHLEGDRLITTIVNAIKGATRDSDVFARLGGDEFMMILYPCSLSNATKVVDNINKRLDTINKSGEYPYELSISFGLVEIEPTHRDRDVDSIIALADKKMYAMKQAKKNAN